MKLPIELFNTGKKIESYFRNGQGEGRKVRDFQKINSKDDLKKVAKEMEALFAHQLIKVMRETAGSMSSEQKGLGNSTYMSMFDMEISRLFAERGMGLQDSLVNWMSGNIYEDTGNKIDNDK